MNGRQQERGDEDSPRYQADSDHDSRDGDTRVDLSREPQATQSIYYDGVLEKFVQLLAYYDDEGVAVPVTNLDKFGQNFSRGTRCLVIELESGDVSTEYTDAERFNAERDHFIRVPQHAIENPERLGRHLLVEGMQSEVNHDYCPEDMAYLFVSRFSRIEADDLHLRDEIDTDDTRTVTIDGEAVHDAIDSHHSQRRNAGGGESSETKTVTANLGNLFRDIAADYGGDNAEADDVTVHNAERTGETELELEISVDGDDNDTEPSDLS